MPIALAANSYGKSRVRVVKVERQGAHHEMKDLSIDIALSGEFTAAYEAGDNRSVLPTDTMKNTVYALARRQPLGEIEEFGQRLADHFLARNPQIASARIALTENPWKRILVDEYTTLKETRDRLFGTIVKADWLYQPGNHQYGALWNTVRHTIVEVVAGHDSQGVQHTLYAIGETILERVNEITEIHISMPNRHCLLVDLSPFGLDNPNEVFLPIDEPHGLIEATLRRSSP